MPIRSGSVQIKPWLLIAHARACFYFNVVVNKQIIQSFTCIVKIVFEWSGGGTAGFCPEPCTWVTEQNKDEAQCGCCKWPIYCEETHLRQVWLGTFFSGKLNCLVSLKRDLILQCLSQRFCSYFAYKFKWQMSFFSATLFRVDSKRLNKFSILTRRIKIPNMLFLHFCTNWPTLLLFFFSLRHLLLRWQQNVKLIWFWTRQIK